MSRGGLLTSFDLDGVRTSARSPIVAIYALAWGGGVALGLVAPGEWPKWIPVLGPDGFVLFEVDPIEMPSAKLLRR